MTVKLQDRLAGAASVAVHWTSVVPIGNAEPDVRVQLTCTGATPPVVVGDANDTATALPLVDAADRLPGQLMVSAGFGVGGGVVIGGVPGEGDVGDDEHATANREAATSGQADRRNRGTEENHRMGRTKNSTTVAQLAGNS